MKKPRATNRLTILLLMAAALLPLSTPAGAEPPKVGVLPLTFEGSVRPHIQAQVNEQLVKGLSAAGLTVVSGDAVAAARGEDPAPCTTPECRRKLSGGLGCAFLAGGNLAEKDRLYTLKLWIAHGHTGEMAAEKTSRCDICGQQKLAEMVELVASDLRASIKHVEAQLAQVKVTTAPTGATLLLDGEVVGKTPVTLPLPAGEHKLTAQLDGHYPSELTVKAVSGVEEAASITLIPIAGTSAMRTVGWIGVAGGIVALGAGIAMIAMHNKGTECDPGAMDIPGGQCQKQYETGTAGGVLTGVGLAAALVGGYLVWRSHAADKKDDQDGEKTDEKADDTKPVDEKADDTKPVDEKADDTKPVDEKAKDDKAKSADDAAKDDVKKPVDDKAKDAAKKTVDDKVKDAAKKTVDDKAKDAAKKVPQGKAKLAPKIPGALKAM